MTGRSDVLSVLICRGCCCGTEEGPDPARHLDQIRQATAAVGGRLKVTNCIGPCDRKNVVVVRSRSEGERWMARYYGAVGQREVDSLCAWVAADPALAEEPASLATCRFRWPLPRPQ